MDVSATFRQIVREKRSLHSLKTPKDEILPRTPQIKSPFLVEALAIAKGVKRMRKYMLDHASDYIDAHRHFANKRARMTDRERDEIDEEMNICMRECCKKIDTLKLELDTSDGYHTLGENAREHLGGVVMDLYKRLEDLSKLHAQHKGLRMQHQLEERHSYYNRITPPVRVEKSVFGGGRAGRESGAEDMADELLEQEEGGDDEDLDLTESERDKYKQENTQLQHNFETLIDKTREIEKQVIEISHLQTLFADKVSQQKEAIEDIHKKAIESVDSVQRGNEYLQSASSSGRDFRFFILIFLLLCSFSLLFLHWYD
jgi:syntaxin 18